MNTAPKKPSRCTNAEKRARVSEIIGLVVRGKSRAEILRFAAENWRIGERQAESYLADAHHELEQSAKVVARREFGKALARLELLFCRAFEANRWRDALAAQAELNRLMGFDNAQKVEPGTMDPVHGVSVVCYLPDNGRATDSPNPIIPHTGE